jgi:hypothetical protein
MVLSYGLFKEKNELCDTAIAQRHASSFFDLNQELTQSLKACTTVAHHFGAVTDCYAPSRAASGARNPL